MKSIQLRIYGALFAMASAGCNTAIDPNDEPPIVSSSGSGSFELVVAPLDIDSRADYACYAIEVVDTHGDEVWSAASLCSNKWGLGSDGTFSYIGLCEAAGDGMNSVTIELIRLVAEDGSDLGNWPAAHPPTYTTDFLCVANKDTVVKANFLVITEGTKGFLDVSVSVQEIACNAKVDCHSEFLGDDSDMGTIVVALACDAAGDDFTEIMIDEIVLTCNDRLGKPVVVSVDPASGLGAYHGYPKEYVAGAIGNAGVSADGTSFFTLGIGIKSGWTGCKLSTRMAANDGRDMTENDQFPVILATAIPFGFNAAGVFGCAANPLDGAASGLYRAWGTRGNLDFHACLNEDASIGLCD